MREHLNKIKKRDNNNNNKNKMKSDIRYIIYIAISTKQLNMNRGEQKRFKVLNWTQTGT